MANPTTNYSFVLPTSSDLVTDLPADFDVALQGVDTRLKALQPGTTAGDLAYSSATANTNVRLGIGTAGQVLAVSGGVPAWTTTADVTPLTTKGDLFTFSTVDARLAVGTNGQVLTADSSEATGLKFASPSSGSMTLLSTTTLSSTSTTITVSANSFKNLYAVIRNLATSNNTNCGVRINSKSGATDYNIRLSGSNAGSGFNYSTSNSFMPFNAIGVDGFGSTSDNNGFVQFADCNSTSAYKVMTATMGGSRNSYVINGSSAVAETSVITGITFVIFDSFTFTGGTVQLYGVL